MKTQKRSSEIFPFCQLKGSHYEIGLQHGEAFRDLIKKHLKLALDRITSKLDVSYEEIMDAVIKYRPYVLEHAKFLDEEITGIAEAANITLAEAYFLQLRAEVYRDLEENDECTTFAVLPEATKDGVPLVGQNADLPELYSEIGVIVEIIPENGSSVLMLTPAGQVSYIGINNKGLGVFANFLKCDGWRVGFPRYMLSRLALQYGSVDQAVNAVRSVPRASSRNLIMLDTNGNAVDLETTATRDHPITPENGLLAHANHYIADELLEEERATDRYLENTHARFKRMTELLSNHHGDLDANTMMSILRDRETYPHALCREVTDGRSDTITFASVIAQPSKGSIWVAMGPPNKYEYKCFTFAN